MTLIDGEAPRPIGVSDVMAAYKKVTEALKPVRPGNEQIDELEVIVGGAASYRALLHGSETILEMHNFDNGVAAPYVRALWLGLVVGAVAARAENIGPDPSAQQVS